jgi:hypothetical protein
VLARGFLIAGLGLLLVAWSVGNAPFSSPDEAAHFVRAAGLARGQLVGQAVGPGPTAPGREGVRLRWEQRTTRSVALPASIDPAGLGCDALRPQMPATCVQTTSGPGSIRLETPVATYDPLPYLAPGLATRLSHTTAVGSLRTARLASAALALLLVALGLSTASSFWSRAGTLLALTPGTVFVLASLSANSLEIAGAVALSLPLFRFGASGQLERRGLLSMALGGLAMVGSRPTSIAWLGVAVSAAAISSADARRALREHPAMRLPLAVWAIAVAISVLWEKLVEPAPPHGLNGSSLRAAVTFVPEMLREYIGVFGSLDTRPPALLALPIAAALAGIVGWALVQSDVRGRIALLLIAAAALVLPIGLNATVLWFTGYALQGRHVTAVIVLVPIFAGVALDARGVPVPRLAAAGVAVAWALTQLAYWLYNAHRHAVGVSGTWSFLGRAPGWLPGDFALWAIVAAAGSALAAGSLVRRPALDARV